LHVGIAIELGARGTLQALTACASDWLDTSSSVL